MAAATFLSEIQRVPGPFEPFRAMSPDGRFLYTPDAVLDRDVSSGLITGSTPSPVSPYRPRAMALGSADAAFLYVTGYDGISVLALDPVTGIPALVEVEPHPASAGSDAHVPAVSPDGTNLYATGSSSLQTYLRDPVAGTLEFVDEIEGGVLDPEALPGLRGTVDLVVSPDGAHVYVAARTARAVVAFARTAPDGALVHLATYTSLDLNAPELLAMSPDGRDVYVTTSVGIARWERNPFDGTLVYMGYEPDDLAGELAPYLRAHDRLVMSRDGTRLLGQRSSIVVVYDRDVVTGHLDVVTIEQVGGKLDAALGPDGAHVYVGSKTMVVFELETFSCSPTPAAGCRPPAAPLRSAVSIKDDDDPGDDKFNWKSRPAGITAIADFGDPAGDDHVAFCVYDASASPQPVMEAVAPAGSTCALEPCWDLSRPTQLKYVDSSRLPDGVEKITARQRLADRGNLKVKGKGYAVRVPALPLTTPVRVQLQSRTGACWEATFSAPKKNDAVTFAGKSD